MHFPLIFPVGSHTANLGKGSVFFALEGRQYNGGLFIQQAIDKGISTVVCSAQQASNFALSEQCEKNNVTLLIVDNPLLNLALYSAHYNGNPAKKLKIIGVTGTKGKTTSVFLIAHILKTAGYKVGIISTLYNSIDDVVFPTSFTTPHADYIHVFLRLCVEQKVDMVIMETSAQASSLYRVHGIEFEYLLFTNFSQEHGEFYSSQEDYFHAKTNLINQIKSKGTLIYNSSKLALNKYVQSVNCVTYAIDSEATHTVTLQKMSLKGSEFIINDKDMYCVPLVGEFNVENTAGAIGVCYKLRIDTHVMKKAVQSFVTIAGRMERFSLANGAQAYIDNAHTPSSFQAVLSCLKPYTENLIVVFGAGGDRDSSKRYEMGRIASLYADQIIITTDNPRSEDPIVICEQIYRGITANHLLKTHIILDRAQAIHKAYALSDQKSCIALLGKGNKEVQIYRDATLFFSEKEIIHSLQ